MATNLAIDPEPIARAIRAAGIRNACRRAGIQVGTIDALLAQLCIRHDLLMLTTDNDFRLATRHCPLRVWGVGVG